MTALRRATLTLGWVALLATSACGGAPEEPRAHAPREAREAPTVAPPPEVAPQVFEAARSVEAALAARGVSDAPVPVASIDVDGDGTTDEIFRVGSSLGCILARRHEAQWRVDVLPPPLGGAPSVTACAPPVPYEGGALLVVSADNGMTDARQGVVQLFTATSGEEPSVAFQEMVPFTARWSARSIAASVIELSASGAEPALVPGEVHKQLTRGDGGQWYSSTCWSEQAPDGAVVGLGCSVTPPDGTRERMVESQRTGPPVFPGPATVVLPGSADPTASGARTWCVRFESGRSAWLELPASVTAPCPPIGRGAP